MFLLNCTLVLKSAPFIAEMMLLKEKLWKMKFWFSITRIYRSWGTERDIMLRLVDICDEKYLCMLGFIFTYIKHITGEYPGDYRDHTDLLSAKFLKLLSFWYIFNPLNLNDPYRSRTAPLTSKRCILYIYSTNIGTEYFTHGILSVFSSSKCSLFHNSNVFGPCIIHILYTECANIKKIIPSPKGK